ncbi:ninein-like [Mugil cephalus]|uniref:ninein-like n=1 Tax=Mugil cephalus TaxID=48193 RepID=UPI001FB77D6A|nr:ninein-like [Mugil cephalus]XP_047441954.1 ninein-like [Mugil cephalus]
MDVIEDNMSLQEMLEKIAELDYSQSHLRDLNAEMRTWLDVADDDMALLRSENAMLRKQVKDLEMFINKAQQVEAEPCWSAQANDHSVKRCSEKKIQMLETESIKLKEQNKKLNAELTSLQQERDQDKISLSNFKVSLHDFEFGMEEVQYELQHKDEVIHQKNLQLQHFEETVEEFSDVIKDLRLTNQELKKQLEDKLAEASFAAVNDLMREKEGSFCPPLSFAEEIKLLASAAENSFTHVTDLRHEETEAEELLEPQSLTVVLQTKSCADKSELASQRPWLFVLCIFILAVLTFMASGNCGRNSDLFSFDTWWNNARLMFRPYCSVHYGALPPI